MACSGSSRVIINITDAQDDYAREIEPLMKAEGIRVQTDLRYEKLGFKIREAQLQKMPYMVIAGDNEMKTRTLICAFEKVGTETQRRSVLMTL